jgi:N-acyl-D-amino-acid deacylase
MHDLVIRGATIVDGTGKPAFQGDVGLDGKRIAAVGKVGAGHREIAADGLLLTPGFVDVHTHYDAQVTWDPDLSPSSNHGCTTVVMGNCGVGFAPCKPEKRQWLIGLMEGVEDIPGAAMHEGIQWEWESFPEYLDSLDRREHVIDFGTQIPHGALRSYVMGQRGADNELANADDITTMKALVHEALAAGALGFSTSRTLLHKSIDGVPVPGTFASQDELFGIAQALQEQGKGVFQLATEHTNVPVEFSWLKELARTIKRPVMFNYSQIDQSPELWKEVLGLLEEAAQENIPIYGQVAGRAIGILMNWQCTAHPFATYESFGHLMGLSLEEKVAKLHDPAFRNKMLHEKPMDFGEFANFVTRSFDKMFLFDETIDYEPGPDQSVAAVARRTGKSPQEVAYDAMLQNHGRAMLYFPLFNYANTNLDILHKLHTHPQTRMGLSDAGAHCGAICDGGMPTFMLTHWTRDRERGPKIPLEHIIRRQTSETASTFGLFDRGVIAPGYKADINLIDYQNLQFQKPELVYDLPAKGRRLLQHAKGYHTTICSGTVIVENDKLTGDRPGHLLRGPQRLAH